jgi:uncharacterized protein YndB with AHSA1/START domain
MNQKLATEASDGERNGVKISRDFDFPRESVFNMFIDPKQAAKFWGPEEAINVLFEIEPKRGGTIRIHDRNSEGKTFETTGTILDIVVPERLTFRGATGPSEGAAPWEALQTMTFEALTPRRTRVTVLVKILAAGSFPGGVESLEEGYQGGWGETFDRLQRTLR